MIRQIKKPEKQTCCTAKLINIFSLSNVTRRSCARKFPRSKTSFGSDIDFLLKQLFRPDIDINYIVEKKRNSNRTRSTQIICIAEQKANIRKQTKIAVLQKRPQDVKCINWYLPTKCDAGSFITIIIITSVLRDMNLRH